MDPNEISFDMATGIANASDAAEAAKVMLQKVIDNEVEIEKLSIKQLMGLKDLLGAQQQIIHTLYEFWAIVGDNIQKEISEE
jgi:hypothetical protein